MDITKIDTLRLDGRDFTPVGQDLTMAQHDYVQSYLREAGCEEIIQSDAAPEEKSHELYRRIERAGVKQKLLAGILTEVGTKWTRKSADHNAERFDAITSKEERILIHEIMLFLVTGFFLSGEASSKTSPKSSAALAAAAHGTSSVASSLRETSHSSPAKSPATTRKN